MDLSELLNSAIGQSIVRNVAGQLCVNENQASTAVSMAIPAILAPIVMAYLGKEKRQTNTGAGGLGDPRDDLLGGFLGGRR